MKSFLKSTDTWEKLQLVAEGKEIEEKLKRWEKQNTIGISREFRQKGPET